MFEYRNLWSSVLRSVAAASLILLLTVGLGGLTAAPAAAQAPDAGSITAQTGTGGTVPTAGDQDVDEWENDILNGGGGGGAPATSLGVVHLVTEIVRGAVDWVGGWIDAAHKLSK